MMQVGAMHLDVVVVAPIQARTPAEPITREQVNEQAAKMKRAALRRQQEADDRERARQGAVAASSSRSNVDSSNSGGARSSGVDNSRSSSSSHGASSSGEGNSRSSSHNSSNSSHGTSSSSMGNSRSSSRHESASSAGISRTSSRAGTNAEERVEAAQLSREVVDGNIQAAGKALHHSECKAAEKLLLTDGLRKAEQWKMRQYGHLVKESVGFLKAFGSSVPKVAKL